MSTSTLTENQMPRGSESFLKDVLSEDFEAILDIGVGNGYSSAVLGSTGATVTATCFGQDHWGTFENDRLKNAELCQADVCHLPFREEQFDAVWMSHVLEHVSNTGAALESIRQVMTDDGRLFISVPPYKSRVVGGHFNTGWTPGQLLYILLVHGFDIRRADILRRGYNVHARVGKLSDQDYEFVRENQTYDGEELVRLSEYFPAPLRETIRETGTYSGHFSLRDGERTDSIFENAARKARCGRDALL